MIDRSTNRHDPVHSEDLVDVAKRRLANSALFRGRSKSIHIDGENGTIVLHGQLPSFYLKQLLQTELGQIKGVQRVDNRVRVEWPANATG